MFVARALVGLPDTDISESNGKHRIWPPPPKFGG
jgi:hypothetical protein